LRGLRGSFAFKSQTPGSDRETDRKTGVLTRRGGSTTKRGVIKPMAARKKKATRKKAAKKKGGRKKASRKK
jgi:hypothetical protein